MLVRLALSERSPEPTPGSAWRGGNQLSLWQPHLKCMGIYGNPRPAITPLSGALAARIYSCISHKSGGSAGRVDQLTLVTRRVPANFTYWAPLRVRLFLFVVGFFVILFVLLSRICKDSPNSFCCRCSGGVSWEWVFPAPHDSAFMFVHF